MEPQTLGLATPLTMNESFMKTIKADFVKRVDKVRLIDDGWMQ